MAQETPILLRNRIIQLKESGQKQSHIANALEISRMTLHRILKLYEAEGSAAKTKLKRKMLPFAKKIGFDDSSRNTEMDQFERSQDILIKVRTLKGVYPLYSNE